MSPVTSPKIEVVTTTVTSDSSPGELSAAVVSVVVSEVASEVVYGDVSGEVSDSALEQAARTRVADAITAIAVIFDRFMGQTYSK
jgi:hypothetical protein